MNTLKWRKEPPSQPGWYWLERERGRGRAIVLVMSHEKFFKPSAKITAKDHGLWAITDYERNEPLVGFKVGRGFMWAGPIPEPEEGG